VNAPVTTAPQTIGDALTRATNALAASGVEAARRGARLLLQEATGGTAETLLAHKDCALTPAQQMCYARLIGRRRAREPVSRILGTREFWGLDFAISPATLDPRPDSETLIQCALAGIGDRAAPWNVLDLGTGSGCLLLALLSDLPAAHGAGCDASAAAVVTARANAAALGLSRRAAFYVGDWAEALDARFDVILANPPYIPDMEISALAPEVRDFDPHRALDGGGDGLAAYRAIAPQIAALLAPRGRAVIEVGAGQAPQASAILSAQGLSVADPVPDFAGVERCIIASVGR